MMTKLATRSSYIVHIQEFESNRRFKKNHSSSFDFPIRVVLFDDDPTYLLPMQYQAKQLGVTLTCCQYIDDFEMLRTYRDFHAAILDFDLGGKTALDLAAYIDCFVDPIPVIIVSAKDRHQECVKVPSCVKSIVRKSLGYTYILDLAVQLGKT